MSITLVLFYPSYYLKGDIAMKQLKYITNIVLAVTFMVLVGCASSSSKDGGVGEYIDDSVITTKVKTAFIKDETVKAHDISVETTDGVVHLSGDVDSQASIAKAVELVRKVKGVKSIKNDLHLITK